MGECFKLKRLWHCAGNGKNLKGEGTSKMLWRASYCGESSFDLGEGKVLRNWRGCFRHTDQRDKVEARKGVRLTMGESIYGLRNSHQWSDGQGEAGRVTWAQNHEGYQKVSSEIPWPSYELDFSAWKPWKFWQALIKFIPSNSLWLT